MHLVEDSTLIGEICHIKAANRGGPRYDAKQPSNKRHGYGNLIVLCGTHHKFVDDDPKTYTAEYLQQLKSDHEHRAGRMDASAVEHAINLLLVRSVRSNNQSGGITAGNVTINVERSDLRGAHDDLLAQAAAFHRERVDQILRNAGPVAVLDGGALILHVTPADAKNSGATVPFSGISGNPLCFPPIGSTFRWESRIDFDGLLTGSNARGLLEPQRAYVMVFRSRILEAVCTSLARGRDRRHLVLPSIEGVIVDSVRKYITALRPVPTLRFWKPISP